MPDINYLKLKVNLIKRSEATRPYCLASCRKILGSPALRHDMQKYTIQFTYQQIISDLLDRTASNHQLAVDLDNLQISLDE